MKLEVEHERMCNQNRSLFSTQSTEQRRAPWKRAARRLAGAACSQPAARSGRAVRAAAWTEVQPSPLQAAATRGEAAAALSRAAAVR